MTARSSAIVHPGQVWASAGRTVRVLERTPQRVLVRDSHGRRRYLTEHELGSGFSVVAGSNDHARGARGGVRRVDFGPRFVPVTDDLAPRPRRVMARRALADIEPA